MSITQIWQLFLDLLFPPRCVNCQSLGSWLCQPCLSQIKFTPRSISQLGLTTSLTEAICSHCQHSPLQNLTGLRATTYFENSPIRSAIHALKYHNHQVVVKILSQMLAEAYQQYELSVEVIMPVPLHHTRLNERGFNQSELLAKGLVNNSSYHLINQFQRTRATVAQVELDAQQRRENVQGAFTCNPKTLIGNHVLLN